MNWNKWIWRRSNVKTKLNCNEIALAFSHTDKNEGPIVRGISVEPGVVVLCAPLDFDMSKLNLNEFVWERLNTKTQLKSGEIFLGHTYEGSSCDTSKVFIGMGQGAAKGLILIKKKEVNKTDIIKEVISANNAIFGFIDDYDKSPIIVNAQGNLWGNARRATKALESLIK